MAISRMQQPRQMYQEGGIMPRLNQLGSGVSSAEQMLQGINQRLESAESSLGEGGGNTAPIGSGSIRPFEGGQPLFDKDGFRLGDQRYGTGLVGGPQMALPESPVSGGPMQSPMLAAMRNMAAGGGMMGRQMYGLGSLVKKAVKGVTGAVKKIAGSDLGKAALLYAGTAGLGSLAGGGGLGSLFKLGTYAPSAVMGNLPGIFSGQGLKNIGGAFGLKSGKDDLLGNVLKVGGYGTVLGGALADYGGDEDTTIGGERNVEALRAKLTQAYRNLRYPEDQIPGLVENDLNEYTMGAGGYANGGRIGFAGGTEFEEYLKAREKFNKQQNAEQLYREYLEDKRKQKVAEQKTMAANGGRIGYAFGNPEQNAINAAGIMNLPLNQNPAGITELDLRETGGFIPPVGVKEKADDIPAMLSNNEFVMTADAVKQFGDGDVNKGAQRMYAMMKKLENGGRV